MAALPTQEFIIPRNSDIGASKVSIEDGRAPDVARQPIIPNVCPPASKPCTYLCGNSLGLISKRSQRLISEEMDVWGKRAVEGHFDHPHGRNWKDITDHVNPILASLVGAKLDEVACMGTLTANLHLLLNSFYKPTKERFKIVCEARAFPSDQYAFASQAQSHGFDPRSAVIEISPRPGEFSLRETDILQVIEAHGGQIAVVLLSGVQYYTGQWFPMQRITEAGHKVGAMVGWDLAHAIGNVPLSLHDWDVDFAVWCSYKYLNAGPGAIGGLFIHEKWHPTVLPRYAGWWGHDPTTRFDMPHDFSPIRGAQGFQQSNPSVLATTPLIGSLQIFHEVGGMEPLRARSVLLTGGLEQALRASRFYVPVEQSIHHKAPGFTIITPSNPEARGAQLSLLVLPIEGTLMPTIVTYLKDRGVIVDERKPNVIRLAPTPLYSSEEDVRRGVAHLEEAFEAISSN
ncbi:Kynureninase (L-kynurenine hydrolase) [Serendipita sp. 399]|nr:Kynureninase (L-kynurenine hydrolase) [Serendipita sp. 399]